MQALGKKVDGLLAVSTCGDPRCLAEEHCAAWTRQRLQKRNGKIYAGRLTRAVNLRKAVEARAKLSMEKARQIRAEGLDWREVMARFDVSESTARGVINCTHWKEYSSPWARL